MRLIKMLGLVAIAAMAAMAFVGASSASANSETIVLCEKAELTCESPFPESTKLVAHAVNPTLLSSLGNVECEKSLSETTLKNKLGLSGASTVDALTFEGNCHLGGTSCTVTTVEKGELTFTKSGALTANVESNGKTKANVKCGSFINCTYGGKPTLTAETVGGETSLFAKEALLTEGKGFLCPSTSKWDATYTALGTTYLES